MAHYTKTTRELRDTAKMLASSPLAPMLNNAAALIGELVADLDAEKEARRKPIEHLLAPWVEVHDDMKRALHAVWACWTNAGELSLAVELVRPHVRSQREAAGLADEKPDGQADTN